VTSMNCCSILRKTALGIRYLLEVRSLMSRGRGLAGICYHRGHPQSSANCTQPHGISCFPDLGRTEMLGAALDGGRLGMTVKIVQPLIAG